MGVAAYIGFQEVTSHSNVTPTLTAPKAAVHRNFASFCVSSSSSALISGVTAMVVYVHEWNFSTTDSSLFRSSVSTDEALWDSTAPHSPGGLSRTGHTVVAVCLGFILVAGILSNFLTLLVFAKFRSLWTPINLILLNISLSDILVCVFGTPFSFAASLRGRWLIGEYGCKWYGFANSLFGIVSLVSLSLLSYERYTTVLHFSQVDISDFRKAWLCVGGSWFYSLFWTLPPLLGWSSYGPEGPGTTCSIQWHLRSPTSISYVLCLFIFCLLLPLLLMLYSYGRILVAIKRVGKVNLLAAQRREHHVLVMVFSMVSCYMLCWMPYGIMALMATFGGSGLVTPIASVVPSILAKFSTVVNPVIYVFFNKQGNRFSTEGKDGSPSSEKQKMDQQDTFYKPSARMAVQKTEKPNSLGYLQWDTRHSVLRVINYYEQSWLTIPQDGDYYIYSRVTFSKEHSVKPLASRVKLRKYAADKDVKDIMKAYCYLSSTKNPHMCTASQGDVITLEKGNQLGLWVQDLSLVDYEEGATIFGIYKL